MPVTDRIRTRFSDFGRSITRIVFSIGLLLTLDADSNHAADSGEPHARSGAFMVIDQGTALLGPDGNEIEHLGKRTHAAGALSRDGKWVAFAEAQISKRGNFVSANLLIQSMTDPGKRESVPMIWGTSGSSFQPLWSSDSKRILICNLLWFGAEPLTEVSFGQDCSDVIC